MNELNLTEKLIKIHEAGINDLKVNKKSNLLITCGEDYSITILKYNNFYNEQIKGEIFLFLF